MTTPAKTTPAKATTASPLAALRTRGYLVLLVLAALIGAPISAIAYGFLALVSKLQGGSSPICPKGWASTPNRCGGRCCRWPWPACWSR